MTLENTEKDRFVCSICPVLREFDSRQGLNMHIRKAHEEPEAQVSQPVAAAVKEEPEEEHKEELANNPYNWKNHEEKI